MVTKILYESNTAITYTQNPSTRVSIFTPFSSPKSGEIFRQEYDPTEIRVEDDEILGEIQAEINI